MSLFEQLMTSVPVQIVVVGDTIVDESVYGEITGYAQEACPIFKEHRRRYSPGGAAKIAYNLAVLGARVNFVTCANLQMASVSRVTQKLDAVGVILDLLPRQGYRNEIKTRYHVGEEQIHMRHDTPWAWYAQSSESTVAYLARSSAYTGVYAVYADYGKGMMPAGWRPMGDPRHTLINMRGPAGLHDCDTAVLNLAELSALTGIAYDNSVHTRTRMYGILRGRATITNLVSTAGADCVMCYSGDRCTMSTLPKPPIVKNVVGGGDAVVAITALLRAHNLPVDCQLAARAGQLSVQRRLDWAALLPELRLPGTPALHVAGQNIAQVLSKLRVPGLMAPVIGFTNGCFDVMHAGHMKFLSDAARQCDYLFVAVNSDESVRRLKGDGRPVQPLAQRIAAVQAHPGVTAVVTQEELTPHALLQQIRPTYLFKGYGYASTEDAVGHELVTAYGGAVKIISDGLPGFSTTETITACGGNACSSGVGN